MQGQHDIKLEVTDVGKNEINGRMLEHYLHNSDVSIVQL